MKLSRKFEEALVYASVVHAGQIRKATGIPYIAHLLGVASIAFEYGADEGEGIGALLHDAAEDAGGAARIDDIRVRFGEKVATIVEGCTDTLETPKPSWRERKEKYLAHLKETDASHGSCPQPTNCLTCAAFCGSSGNVATLSGRDSAAARRTGSGIIGLL